MDEVMRCRASCSMRLKSAFACAFVVMNSFWFLPFKLTRTDCKRKKKSQINPRAARGTLKTHPKTFSIRSVAWSHGGKTEPTGKLFPQSHCSRDTQEVLSCWQLGWRIVMFGKSRPCLIGGLGPRVEGLRLNNIKGDWAVSLSVECVLSAPHTLLSATCVSSWPH